ncbi:hypothetical protein OC521_08510 [Vibrio vulnificus]|nr:hypothetical protein [Vibrio vulnificus]
MDPRLRGNDSWGRGGGVLSFLFFAAELSSDFSFLIFVPRERGAPSDSEHRGSVLALHYPYCWLRFRRCLLRQVHFQTRHLARVDEWIPACAGMTAGGADQFSHPVILANAGTHRIASAVARF